MAANRKLRVLVISLGRIGGVTKYGYLMSAGLARTCEVAAVSSSSADNRDSWSRLAGPHLEVKTFSSVLTMFASFFAIGRFARISRFARDFRPDVIYYPGGHAFKPLLGLLLPSRVPVVLTVHDPKLHAGEDSLAQRFFAWANLLGSDGYVLLNRTQAAAFIERRSLDPARVAVIPLGAFDDHVGDIMPLSQIPGAEGLAACVGGYALFIGRIERYKGIGTLLDAYGRLDEVSRIPLVIAGAGAFTEAEIVLLRGLPTVSVINRWLSETEVATLVALARFVVVPYVQGTQSAVIPLAFAHGVPVVASNAGGLAEQVVDGETGLVFPAGDAEVLARSLRAAFALDDAGRNAMAEHAHVYALTKLSWDVVAGQLSAFFETLTHR